MAARRTVVSTALCGLVLSGAMFGLASPADAHRDYYRGRGGPGYRPIFHPRFYFPPSVYYAPPPVYYAPPPVYYPPAAYYAPPSYYPPPFAYNAPPPIYSAPPPTVYAPPHDAPPLAAPAPRPIVPPSAATAPAPYPPPPQLPDPRAAPHASAAEPSDDAAPPPRIPGQAGDSPTAFQGDAPANPIAASSFGATPISLTPDAGMPSRKARRPSASGQTAGAAPQPSMGYFPNEPPPDRPAQIVVHEAPPPVASPRDAVVAGRLLPPN